MTCRNAGVGVGIMLWLALPMSAAILAGPVSAQIAPRLTGAAVIGQLESARHELAARAASAPHSSLAATSERLGKLADALRKSLGNDAEKPIDTLGKDVRGSAYRASAVVQRTRAYLDATSGCLDADVEAMAEALSTTVRLVADEDDSSKMQPVINGVETLDHRPLFVLHGAGKGPAFALVGANLFDAQCESPVVTATDGQGKLQSVQPSVTGVLPNRIELKVPDGAALAPGSYVLHVVAKHKAFLVGCSAQPQTIAAVQVAPPVKVSLSYGVAATCRAGGADRTLPPVTGTMPDLAGGIVAQQVAIDGCAEPVSYAITAKVTFGDGHSVSVGPISQVASAGITAGLPTGLSLSWDPSVRQIFVRPSATTCKGAY
ncbi:hypothetical protein [Rhodanobacter sp. T12-5]|uniref:hypothetical protein n=1 Tax=Rhodanobacter sp. T12-5 TaxID=2024611 RepID=UPI0011EF0D23|nr:hypothetical protein [Rhodanobacter sp. T12-5]KAA0070914.1 hypothetical protein CIW53_06235 [Rhodanobacter sp. T12-5]